MNTDDVSKFPIWVYYVGGPFDLTREKWIKRPPSDVVTETSLYYVTRIPREMEHGTIFIAFYVKEV
jgi:hypothetical protein